MASSTIPRAAGLVVSRMPPMPTISDILRLYRLRALKHLGQNFLLNPRLIKKIVKSAGPIENCSVLEIGPGPGSLTRGILEAGVRDLTVIERDSRFMPVMKELQEACGIPMTIKQGDILREDLQSIFPEDTVRPWNSDELPPVHIIANLPFNISTPLAIRWLNDISTHSGMFRYGRVKMTLMFQHEVAQRMIAHPGNEQRSRLSVMCQNYCSVNYIFPIKGTSFLPKPEVDAGVVQLIPLKEPTIKQPFKMVEKVVRNIYNQRRHTLPHGVGTLFPKSHKHLSAEMLEMSGVEPTRKPFMLEVEEFGMLCAAYEKIVTENPIMAHYQFR
ncbi:Dimethyladenosine transferase 1, mitochondrial [Hypsibius exemplaris]|uniref:rRNA adenine N(6)-methyltransferase n=1 Tax=Hypsibius exemplaris TaxID=2072580 RepID=A0A1W0WCU2_HYPEX|nr:Dimethyladenosine transferase 1, mitochondrial [Hypsibius exemplaris]